MLAFLSLLAEHSRVNSFILLIMERYRNYYSTGLASALPINLLKKKKKVNLWQQRKLIRYLDGDLELNRYRSVFSPVSHTSMSVFKLPLSQGTDY